MYTLSTYFVILVFKLPNKPNFMLNSMGVYSMYKYMMEISSA